MASVKIDMAPEAGVQAKRPMAEVGPDKDRFGKTASVLKSRQQFRGPTARDILICAAFLSCALTFYLLYAKICILEQTVSHQFEQEEPVVSPASSVAMDATSAVKDGIPIHAMQPSYTKTETANIKNTGLLRTKLTRSRRNAGQTGGDAAWNSASIGQNDILTELDHPFIHVAGITSTIVTEGDWFMWHTDDAALTFTASLTFAQSKFVEILQPGYYFVYSQITYHDRNDFPIGHEVVRKSHCGSGQELRLLHSVRSQIDPTTSASGDPSYPTDSGYAGGIFHLAANDFVGVRPYRSGGQNARQYIANQGSGSYFGMYLLTPDLLGAVAVPGDCSHGLL